MTIPNLNWVINGRPVITAYTVMVLIGVLVTMFYMMYFANKHGLDDIRVMFLSLLGFAGAFIGGKLLGAIVNYRVVVAFFQNLSSVSSFQDFLQRLGNVFGDSVFYGGLIFALLFGRIYLKKTEKSNMWAYADLAAFGIPLFHGFGRLGCLLTGCCYGIRSSFGIVYHFQVTPGIPPMHVTLFPVQLIESVLNFALFFFLRWLYLHRDRPLGKKAEGKLIWLYLLIYPTYRFILEFFRGDGYRGFALGLSTSQLVSLLLFAFACVMLAIKARREKQPA